MAKMKSVSIHDVASEARSSLTTVSLVLNKRDGRISQATRARILETANRLGYRPSRLAQGLQAQKAGILAILVPQLRHAFADAYFGELISAIQETAGDAGYKILLEVAHPVYVKKQQHLELFRRHYIDGMLCLGVTNQDTYLADFSRGGPPMVVVNNYLPKVKLNHVRCDYEQAGRLAGKHLVNLGHRHIALIHGAKEVQTTAELKAGLVRALSARKLTLPKTQTEDGLYTEEGGAIAAEKLIKRCPKLTAIMAGNDKMAIGAIRSLKTLGRKVPADVSVVGCDDMHQADFCDPPLTTVHTPLYEVGQRACERLLELMDGTTKRVQETFPVSMTVRQSTCRPRSIR